MSELTRLKINLVTKILLKDKFYKKIKIILIFFKLLLEYLLIYVFYF